MGECLVGVDIGTSTVKATVLDAESGGVLAAAAEECQIDQPRPGYAEQNPEDWWATTTRCIRRAVEWAGISKGAVRAIGVSGQMHGVVCLDAGGHPVRPAIIWPDTRSRSECDALLSRVDASELARRAPGMPATGLMAPTLMWLAGNEPAVIAETETVLLPKDYVRFRLTGEVSTDVTDAAGTWLFDVREKRWSEWLLSLCRLDGRYLPSVQDSAEIAGTLQSEACEQLGLSRDVTVVHGCADQPAQALGHNLLDPGIDLVTIGTGGQVVHVTSSPCGDPDLRFMVLNHAISERWYALAATLAAGLSLRWLRDTLGLVNRKDAYEHLSGLASQVPPGADGLVYLPYLAGERTPHMDPLASGAFVGLRLQHGPGHLARAVMEGVCFSLAGCLDLVRSMSRPDADAGVIASGGGARSHLWRQLQADIYGVPIMIVPGADHACVGAAVMAGVGIGIYSSVQDACGRLPQPEVVNIPQARDVSFYRQRRQVFDCLYSNLKDTMHSLRPVASDGSVSPRMR